MKDALAGVRVLDLSINAPGPFASMMLADLGAEVTCITHPGRGAPAYAGAGDDPVLGKRGGPADALMRGKASMALDLKSGAGRSALLSQLAETDVVLSEMRPGKLEALGLGYATLAASNPLIVLCEITGYGRHHPRALSAGHDINYIAGAGALDLIRDRNGRPVLPQNILADYAGGGHMAVTAILAALLKRARTGQGCRITVSMETAVRYLLTDLSAATALGGLPSDAWRGSLGGGMPTYGVYRTADGAWMAVGALEPKFVSALADALAWPELVALMEDRRSWPEARAGLAARFACRSRDAWTALFAGTEACVTPVLSIEEIGPDALPALDEVLGTRGD